jgi:homogentisate 1,2-dioxygenase
MPRYHALGQLPRKHHIQFRQPNGKLYTEQLISTHGFSGPMSTTYHINMPTEVSAWEDLGPVQPTFLDAEPLHHRHLKTRRMEPRGDAVTGRIALMGNRDVIWFQANIAEQMDYLYKNAEGDEILFIHNGSGRMESMYGTVPFTPGDYIVVPRGTT